MKLAPKGYIELFHLMFLRQFSMQINSDLYAIKGGCNLRFFFGSIRYSEDLDIDVCTIAQNTLKQKIDKILSTPPLLKLLQGYGITQIVMSASKQTPTTQRWKIQIHTENSEVPHHTKIECSRRTKNIPTQLANIDIKICQAYHLSPMRLSHYGLKDAITQKITALAERTSTQARDIFDLYFLLHFEKLDHPLFLENKLLRQAIEAAHSIGFEDYLSQVVNFLEPEMQEIYKDREYWVTISNEVFNYLDGLLK